ncbi:MAG: sigma-70 family RNA polymerase sigma factor [Spirochaetota bacterium]
MYQPGEDDHLIKAYLEGDENAFNSLVGRHMDKVFSICYRYTGNHDDASDCAQDIFVKVYNNLHTFRFKSAFSTWLYRIVVNSCKNYVSKSSFINWNTSLSLSSPGDTTVYHADIADSKGAPEAVLEKKEIQHLVMQAVLNLPDDMKMLIILRDFENRSYEEITGITGMKMGTIKSRISRARSRLKEMLKEDLLDEM